MAIVGVTGIFCIRIAQATGGGLGVEVLRLGAEGGRPYLHGPTQLLRRSVSSALGRSAFLPAAVSVRRVLALDAVGEANLRNECRAVSVSADTMRLEVAVLRRRR